VQKLTGAAHFPTEDALEETDGGFAGTVAGFFVWSEANDKAEAQNRVAMKARRIEIARRVAGMQ
jgi:hypothetical protein